MKNRICLIVEAPSLPLFLEKLEQAQALSHFIELRIDTLDNPSPQALCAIAEKMLPHVSSIVTCRSRAHGGCFSGSAIEQNQLLQTANDLGFNYIDIDLALIDTLHIHSLRAGIITSYHDFLSTPSDEILAAIKCTMKRIHPAIMKIATQCTSIADAHRLLRFLLNKNHDEQMIVLGMGMHGRLTRIISPYLGSFLSFAPLSDSESAQALGHLTYYDLKKLYDTLDVLL